MKSSRAALQPRRLHLPFKRPTPPIKHRRSVRRFVAECELCPQRALCFSANCPRKWSDRHRALPHRGKSTGGCGIGCASSESHFAAVPIPPLVVGLQLPGAAT
jgi:hypothetical protein